MTEPRRPDQPPLPTPRQLAKATAIAAAVAGVLLVTTVLPAEYGIDPTGIGGILGLKAMGEAKQKSDYPAGARFAFLSRPDLPSILSDGRYVTSGAVPVQADVEERTDEVSVTLKTGETAEVKAFMKAGASFRYVWSTDGGRLNFDFHGEPPNAPSNVFTSYAKGARDRAEGAFTAKFDGTHGWFWRNRTSQTITVTVKTTGRYEKLERVK